MTNRTTIIVSFIFATLLTTAAVEFFYNSLETMLTPARDAKILATPPGPQAPFAAGSSPRQINGETPLAMSEDYAIILSRNLFGRPPSAKQTALPPKRSPILATTSLDLVLLGTIGGDQEEQRAIIRNKKSRHQGIYRTGDRIEQAQIKAIRRGQIILTFNGKDEILLMEEMKSPPGPRGSRNITMPDVYDISGGNTLERQGITEPSVVPPPATVPRRRMTFKPKRSQVKKP